MKKVLAALAVVAALVFGVAAVSAAAPRTQTATADSYTYHQQGATITVSYTCDDGTIVPGPHPTATVDAHKWVVTLTAHGVDKLDAAMRTYADGHYLTDAAKAFLNDLLSRTTCS